MDGLFLLVGLAIPIGLFVGWCLGIAAWRQVQHLRAEVAALRRAVIEAGIAVPEPVAGAEANPNPWSRPPAAETAPEATEETPAEDAPAAPTPNPWATPQPAPAAAQPTPARPGLEEALTLRWGTWLGAAALLLAGVFLVRTAVEEGWLGPAARCVLAALLGLALVIGAEWLRRRPMPERPNIPWPDYAPQALAAGGVAALFGAAYAASVLYGLLPPLAGFLLMAAAALAGLALALLHGPLVAALGILGAYVTPALVETQDPSLPGLFLYLLVVTAAALAVMRQVGGAWLGRIATVAAACWVVAGGILASAPQDLWAPALFVPVAAGLHLALLPGAALEGQVGRRLAWIPVAALAAAGLTLMPDARGGVAPAIGLLLLTPVAIAKGAREPRLDRLPMLAALVGLLMLLAWPIGAWSSGEEAVTIEGVVQAILPATAWPPGALLPFLLGAAALAAMHAGAGAWMERRAPHPLHWAALPAAVPVLVLLVAYARVRGFALDLRWGLAALALAAALVGAASLARREGATARVGVHAAGAVASLALGVAMVLSDAWLTLAVALFLPPLAWIEARTDLGALRRIALAVAALVLVRLLLNPAVLGYAFGTAPVLNGLLPAYGVPAACFALAAWMFRRRGDDATVAVLEAGAIAFATVLVLLQIRHAVTAGAIADVSSGWTFREGALQVTGLWVLATGLRLLNAHLGDRPVQRWGWRVLAGLALLPGVLLILRNPAFEPAAQIAAMPLFNELLLAYAIPAVLAALAARTPDAKPGRLREVLAAYAFAASLAWVTLAVRHAFHPLGMALELAGTSDAEIYAYSGAWLALAALLLALGIVGRIRVLRLAALALMALTIAKAFLVDMGDLMGLWRVVSFLALGLALIALGWVYRRFEPGAART
ncbi:DUF2339 domain-containing protein [Falsiroseomonas sp.]|uniref:DUF2339 domain-containing protein n=1 Tax=Falsiroseomonas sp. TaxID=2870721 RepID=UPI00356445F7